MTRDAACFLIGDESWNATCLAQGVSNTRHAISFYGFQTRPTTQPSISSASTFACNFIAV